jgi:HAD superfamily hydrolase (TIGR01509 family)
MTKAILFDAGNTLVLFDCDYAAQILEAAGFPVSPLVIRHAEHKARFAIDGMLLARMERAEEIPKGTASMHHSRLWQLYFSKLLAFLGIPEERQEPIIVKLAAREKASALGLWRKLEPGLRLILSELRHRGYSLAVVSNSDGRLKEKLRGLLLAHYFDLIIDSDEVGIEKPDPRLFQFALQKCGLNAAEALYIGDLYSVDVLAARKAGLHALLYDPAGLYGGYETTVVRWWSDLLALLPRRAFADAACAMEMDLV